MVSVWNSTISYTRNACLPWSSTLAIIAGPLVHTKRKCTLMVCVESYHYCWRGCCCCSSFLLFLLSLFYCSLASVLAFHVSNGSVPLEHHQSAITWWWPVKPNKQYIHVTTSLTTVYIWVHTAFHFGANATSMFVVRLAFLGWRKSSSNSSSLSLLSFLKSPQLGTTNCGKLD